MEILALAQLKVEKTNTYIFQRRDGKAPTSPHRLGWFGGHIEEGESPRVAIERELGEETSLNISRLIFNTPDVLEVPPIHASSRRLTVVHLFETIVKPSEINFIVHEGSGSEIYTNEELLLRNDVAQTVRYILENRVI